MKISDRIKGRENLTPTENQIVQFIKTSPEKAVNMPLDELSATIYVSKSTIIRFCKKLGFHGHKELCVELAKELNSFGSDEIDFDMAMPFSKTDTPAETAKKMMSLNYKAVNDTLAGVSLDGLNELAKMIYGGRPFYVYAPEENWLAAQDISARMQALGYQVHADNPPGASLSKAISQNPNTAALFISYSGANPGLTQSARLLSDKNVPVFLICGPFSTTLRKLADTVIEAGFYEPQPRIVTIGSRSAVLFVLDILYALVFNMDTEKHAAMLRTASEYRRRGSENPEGL